VPVGMSGYCGQLGDHGRCWFSIQTPATLGTYGQRDDGHRWVCQCPCHEHQGYPPCPGDHDQGHDTETSSAQASVQLNLF
jgi:hypothetical protein